MFPNESSSDEISTESSNAFVQNRKEPAGHRGVCRGVATLSQQALAFPVDQVPVVRDTTGDRTMSESSSSNSAVAAVSLLQDPSSSLSTNAAIALTQHSNSKDEPSLREVAMTEEGVTQEQAGRIVMHAVAAAGPCDPKSEAVGTGEVSPGSSANFSASVIFPRSRCGDGGELVSPSLQMGSSDSSSSSNQGAPEGSNASGHLGSSSSSSLQYRAQSSSSIQAKSDSAPLAAKAESDNLVVASPHTTNVKLWSSQASLDIPQRCVASNAGWGIPRGLGLRGGGESSLNSGTAGWGTPPSASNSNNAGGWGQNPPNSNTHPGQSGQWGATPRPINANQAPPGQPNPVKGNQSPQQGQQQQQQQQQQPTSASGGQQGGGGQQSASQPPQSSQSGNGSGSGQQQPPQNGSPSWAQAAGGAGGGGGPGKGPGQPPGPNGGGSSSAKQLEQLNSMREALFSQDGWGGQHVNQDTGWDIPTSPEPGMKDNGSGGPVWKPNVNNGTDLWEANLRNGGQPPPTTSKTPWGHTPATNIGGTWGEDDDVGDSSNVWHGVPSNNTNNPPGPQWGGGAPAPVPKKDSEWGGSNWGDPRDMRGNMMDPRSNDRDMRGGGMGMDLRGGGGDMMRPDMMMRGDPRGPGGPDPRMGRMNGEAPMWGGPKNQQPPGNQWAGPPPKDMKSSSGWEELSPTAARRQIPNYDDGTSLWGNPGQQQASTWRGNKQHDGVSHWKEIPTPNMGGRGGAGGMQCPPGMGQNRMPGSGGMKPDGSGPMWNHPQRNGSWADGPGGPHDGPGGWADEGPGKMGGGGWNDSTLLGGGQGNWGGPKPKNPMSQGGWGDGSDVDPSSWGHPKPGPKPLTKDIVWASKQFRILSEMGFKKEDVENALRTCNMSLEDALEYLQGMNPGVRGGNDGWRRHEEHSPFDMGVSGGPHPGGPGGGGYPGRGYNPTQQMPFAPPGPGVNNAPSLMNSANNPSLGSINTMSPAIVQKILTQQPPPAAQPAAQQSFQSVPRNPQSQPQPSAAQLRMLVQQIQMAVQAGYLNHQILNQPLAPQTLLLLNQLLQQIKMLQNLLQQQAVTQVQPMGKGQSAAVLQISVQITKTKQQITNLQNQIAAQQAIYVKQQQHQQHMAPQGPQTGDFFKPQTLPDPISALHGNFGELSMKEPQQASFQTQQSRLNQWKLPSLDKDGDGNEFDRAPGTTTKTQSHTSPNMNPLLPQGDSTWSSVGRGGGDTGWPDTSAPGDGGSQSDGKEWPNSAAQASAAFTDLVPEFEPGKPWKGNQMKSIEDDPSITPGSVVRSPLSLATIKDTEIFSSSNKTSPPASVVASSSDNAAIPSLSLSSTTWSFNPTSSSSSAFASLGTNGSNGSGRGGPTASSWGGMPPGGGWSSTWLLLRNLTPQIDGSTLKTLCLQHGPLQSFHLYLNHGLALAKYQSREEAAKAQGALNNCVLGNTTIFAESPAEAEVHGLLQHLHVNQPQGPSVASGWGSMRGGGPNSSQNAPPQQGPQPQQQGPSKPPPDAWGGGSSGGGGSQLWPSPSSSSLWGASGLDGGDQHRATPSSLNSFLPGDLLGEGSM